MRPDLILMDFQMPGINGVETTRRLRAIGSLASVPVIMLTGNSDGNAVVESIKAGACDFIVKPFDKDTLLAKIARVLGADSAATANPASTPATR